MLKTKLFTGPLACLLFACLMRGAELTGLRQLMATPFASELTVSPDERHLAWVVDEAGKRNVWLADAPLWKARKTTNFVEDDGLEIGELAWSPDSRTLLFTRAGEFDAARQPNPTGALQAPKAMLWTVTVGGEPRSLTEGHAGIFSPDNRFAWFLRSGQAFRIAAAGGRAESPFQCAGTVSDLTWSPNGRHLVFRNNRESHSFIGLFALDSRHLTYLDPSVDDDSSPVWSPDSKSIAFLRQPAATALPMDAVRREGSPWSIRVWSMETGSTHEVFRAERGGGSVHHAWTANKQLFWSSPDSLYFGWEYTGWLHIYEVATNRGTPRELTPGEGEIYDVSLSHDGKRLVYSSNIGDLESIHLSAITMNGGAATQVSGGSGAEWNGVSIHTPTDASKSVAFLASTYNTAAHVDVSYKGARRSLGQPAFAAGLLKPEAVTFKSTGDITVHAQLFRTNGAVPRPAIVFVHGGSRRQMLLGFHPMHYYSNAYELNQYLAARGYLVLSVNYRSGTGYGLNFREAPGSGPSGGSEYADVKAAAEYLKTRVDVDPNRIGIWGGSWGGYLTALALARDSATFKAGVDFHGVHDWRLEMDLSQNTAESAGYARLAFDSSPLAFVNGWRSPVLLIHGDDDRNVAFLETVRLVEELRAHGIPFEQLIFPGETHHLLLWQHWVQAYSQAIAFFDHNLKSSPTP